MGPVHTPDSFARRLKTQRRLRELKQRQVSERSGSQKEMISKWECGAGISHTNLYGIANALEVSCDYLIGRITEPTSIGPLTATIHANLQTMDAQLLRVITTYLDIDTQHYQREMVNTMIMDAIDHMTMAELEHLARLSDAK